MENRGNKNKVLMIIMLVVIAVNVVFTGVIFGFQIKNMNIANQQITKYSLYIGTNDKDTYIEEIPFDECLTKVTEICTKYTDGCTIYEANGYWKDETSTITKERTIACILEDIELNNVYKICDEVIVALNQNSILIETSNVVTTFYSTDK